MKAIEFTGHNVKIAEDQPEYETLPALFNKQEGSMTFCFELDEPELEQVKKTGKIWIKQLTFGKALQPIGMSCLKEDNFKLPEKIFLRVANEETGEGLWYNKAGEFIGLIHNEFDFCKNSEVKMPFDKDTVGFLSAVDSLEALFEWFPQKDIDRLQDYGYYVTVYKSSDYKFCENHWLINQETAELVEQIKDINKAMETADVEEQKLKKV